MDPTHKLYQIYKRVEEQLGPISVIPLRGKKPEKSWKKQQRQPLQEEKIRELLVSKKRQAYGIITGRVSKNLIGIDFDDKQVYEEISQRWQELTQTVIVKTRRGYHVYLRITDTQEVIRGTKFPGGQIQGEGAYLVGPGSEVAGHTYEQIGEHALKEITREKLEEIKKELDTALRWRCPDGAYNADKISASQDTGKAIGEDIQTENTTREKVIREICQKYVNTAPMTGRNNALYTAAQRAKAAGIRRETIEEKLAKVHIEQPPTGTHAPETRRQRQQEATRTIASAYEGTLARKRENKTTKQGNLPNTVREELLKHGATLPRLIETAVEAGYKPGQRFTPRDIIETIKKSKTTIGSTQIRKGLEATTRHGIRIIPKVQKNKIKITSNYPPPVGDTDNEKKNTALSIPALPISEDFVDNHESSVRGRTGQVFIFPSIDYLCSIFGVDAISADILSPSDLVSDKRYRMALLREFILRYSPELSVDWHADRLDVSTRTVRRYLDELNVLTTKVFLYEPLTWDTVDDKSFWECSIRTNEEGRQITPGQWIQDSAGDRYPAIKGVALKWMKEHPDRQFIMCWRRPGRMQLPQDGVPMFVHEVIWRRKAGTEWFGGEYDFPPVSSSKAPNSISVSDVSETVDPTAAIDDAPDMFAGRDLSSGFFDGLYDVYALLDEIPVDYLSDCFSGRAKLGLSTYKRLNRQLSLIDGLGKSRINQLEDAGIFTLEQMIVVGEKELYEAIPWRGREYLSVDMCARWIKSAKVLLAWEEPDYEALRAEAEYQERLKARRDYKKNYYRFVEFLRKVADFENDVFGTSDIPELPWNNLLIRFEHFEYQYESDDLLFFRADRVNQIHVLIRDFCALYIERIDRLMSMSDDNLLHLPSTRWKRLRNGAERQIERFARNDVWPGWNK